MSKHPLSGFGNFDPDERQAKDEWLHEEVVVKALLGVYRQSSDVKFEILNRSKLLVGHRRLSLIGLRDVTGISDKFIFKSAIVDGIVKNCAIDKMLRRLATRTVMQRFYEQYDDHMTGDDSGLDFALVVKCPFVPTGLVFHTATDTAFTKGFRFIAASKDLLITIETFEQFAKTELTGAGR